jgi:MFS family permease
MQLSEAQQTKIGPPKDERKQPIVSKFTEARDNLEEKPPSLAQSRGFLPVLQNRRFLLLWSGQVFSQLADKFYLVLTIALISSYFKQSEGNISSWVSPITIAFTIPAVLFGSLAGVYVDRWPKKEVLVVSNLARGLLVLVLPLLFASSRIHQPFLNLPVGFWLLLVVTFLVSTLTQFFAPAEQTAIPLIVKRHHLLAANSLYTTTMMALLIVGFAVGEPLLALADKLLEILNLPWNFGKELVVGGAYVISSLLLLFLKTGEKKENLAKESPHVCEDIWDGIRYLGKNYRVRNALIQLVILFSVFAALVVLAVSLADTIPGMKAQQFGILLAAAGFGMACGAAVLGNWGQNFSHARLSLWGSVGVAGSLIGLSLFVRYLWLELLMSAFLGGFAALVGVPMQTTIQAETPEDMRGKVFGLQNNAVNIALSLPLALAGVAETFFGLRFVLVGLAGLALVGGMFTWLLNRRSLRREKKIDKYLF